MRRIGNYIVENQPLARGGMGQIFRGRDDLGNSVAIKEILPEYACDLAIISRIEKEVEFLVKIDHPSIVKLYSAFRDNETQCYYIVMEMVEGMNIEQYVMRNGPMQTDMAVDLMLKILDAMQYIHSAHIVHRDIKPSNIMIRPDNTICLLDFGVAKDMDSKYGNTIAGSIIGTSGYMSPEQAEGYSINFRSDIYSLGCVFFYMLTGHHAFNTLSSEFETKDAIISSNFPRLSKYLKKPTDGIQKVLDKATAKNMMQRYESCYDFMSALRNGTYVSSAGMTDLPVKITVGRENCDITVNDPDRKISRHHADIELKEFTGGLYYVFTDCSANGTLVNDRRLNKVAISIPGSGPDPKIYLAGVSEGFLDWKLVVEEINKRRMAAGGAATRIEHGASGKDVGGKGIETGPTPPSYRSDDEGESALGWLIAAYIFAILGGLLGVAFGVVVATSKITNSEGKKIYKYKKLHRLLGWTAVAVSAISMIVWRVCAA